MSSHRTARVARVLSGALRLWGVPAAVERDPDQVDGLVLRTPSGGSLQVAAREPHGWLLRRDGRVLGSHAGLPGLLRTLRDEL
ncbi:MAG: hypothetical protein FJY40_00555 [Betaproteobacteria bacterium]|nr:hypothetical protein [Betaproteobacteria bacterium]